MHNSWQDLELLARLGTTDRVKIEHLNEVMAQARVKIENGETILENENGRRSEGYGLRKDHFVRRLHSEVSS